MALTRKQEKALRTKARELKPVVLLGQKGLTDSVLAELDSSLKHHELIKVRIRSTDRDTRDLLISEICTRTGCDLVQKIGNCISIYRPNPDEPVITLP